MAFDKDVLKALDIQINDDELKELYQMIYDSFNQWFDIGKSEKLTEKPIEEFLDVE
jgi:hypothetical protein